MKNIAENEIKSSCGVSERKKYGHKQKQKEEFVNVPKEQEKWSKEWGERGREGEIKREKNQENAPRKAEARGDKGRALRVQFGRPTSGASK